MSFSGTHAVIVGGSSGIGLATAQAFVAAGASVTVAGATQEKLVAAVAMLGPSATGRQLDARNEPDVRHCFDNHGAFDHLVISLAGGAAMGRFSDITDTDLRTVFEIKLWAYLNIIRRAIPHLAAQGSITVVTGVSAKKPAVGTSALGAANGAMETMVPSLALELAPIRVNAVSPGVVDTPAWDRIPPDRRKVMFDEISRGTAIRRVGQPSEIAAAILALAGNGFITGVVLPCDGGRSIG